MTYHQTKTTALPFEQAVTATREALSEQGFGIITEIDVRETMKTKIDEDFRPYIILGACNPRMAFQALQLEDKVGAMLPCNVVVQDKGAGQVEISAIDPVASMQAIDNDRLKEMAGSIADKLRIALDKVPSN